MIKLKIFSVHYGGFCNSRKKNCTWRVIHLHLILILVVFAAATSGSKFVPIGGLIVAPIVIITLSFISPILSLFLITAAALFFIGSRFMFRI